VQLKVSGTGRRAIAAAGVVAAIAGGAVIARADDPPARAAQATGGLAISPIVIERQATVGASNILTVANKSREAVNVTVAARPWTQSASGKTSPNRRKTLPEIAVSEDSFTLAPGANKEVTVTLRSAPRGNSLYGAVEVIGLPRDVASRKGVVAGYRLIGTMRLNPAAKTYNLSAGAARIVGKGSNRTLTLAVRNAGNTIDPVTGSVRLRGPLGTREVPVDGTRILPGKSLRLALARTSRLQPGRYTAVVSLRQGSERLNVTKRIRVRR
jgi:hypothetical protein